MNKRGIEISSLPTLKPWLDEMINKANHILNALLRLRKQQLMTKESDEERVHENLLWLILLNYSQLDL
jgi:hypothetical protein